MSWTNERVELLKKLWGDGLSASQIAGELGGVTRNAVIGKVHRLGLSGRAKSSSSSAKPRRPRTTASPASQSAPKRPQTQPQTQGSAALKMEPTSAPVAEVQPVAEPIADVVPMSKRATILTLTERTCKWPIGDPATEDFWFCGLSVQSGKPYCEAHVSVAFQPMSARRDRRR
jgi:GcrA cell cycle regulator